MRHPNLGFKLWLRKYLNILKGKKNSFFKNYTGFFNFLIAVTGVYFAYTANRLTEQSNKLSQAAYGLAKNDTSQQAQITQLKDILIETRAQNDIAKLQADELIKITRESNKGTSISNQILSRVERQTGLTNDQLILSKKADSSSEFQLKLQNQSSLFELRNIFERLIDVRVLANIANVAKFSHQQRIEITSFVVSELEKGLNNKLFLTDKIIRAVWTTHYMYLKNRDLEFKTYSFPKNNVFKTNEDFIYACNDFMTKHMDFMNRMLKRLNFLQDDFYRLIKDDLNDSLLTK